MLSVTQSELLQLLRDIAPVRPVFIWGPPGIGKSALVETYAQQVGLHCVSLLGSQLAPEDLIGVPQIVDGKSRFCPPTMIARDDPYVLFLDELNACTPEVQKAFYSLIHDRRIGEYHMPPGSVVVGAGNRKQDRALARPIASALVNRLIHVELKVSTDEWLQWGRENHLHESVLNYVSTRPDHLLAPQAQDDAPFSTPRSWHMLSDALRNTGERLNPQRIQVLAAGCLSGKHAAAFAAFARNWLDPYSAEEILSGERSIPYDRPEDATFMLASVRAYLNEHLPHERAELTEVTEWLVLQAIELIEKTAEADAELVRYFITPEHEDHLPPWFVNEVTNMWAELLQVDQNAEEVEEAEDQIVLPGGTRLQRPTRPFPSPQDNTNATPNRPFSPFRRSGSS